MLSLARRTIGARCARAAAEMFHGNGVMRVAMLLIASALTANTARVQTSSRDQAERPSWGAQDATSSRFLIGRPDVGEMTLSGYTVIRYINELPATQTFVDHLGNLNVIDPRNDIQFHLINRHPDRFLFGTDEVAPDDRQHYLAVYDMYAPLFVRLTPDASEKFRKTNYARMFDEARRRVRAWERVHLKETPQ